MTSRPLRRTRAAARFTAAFALSAASCASPSPARAPTTLAPSTPPPAARSAGAERAATDPDALPPPQVPPGFELLRGPNASIAVPPQCAPESPHEGIEASCALADGTNVSLTSFPREGELREQVQQFGAGVVSSSHGELQFGEFEIAGRRLPLTQVTIHSDDLRGVVRASGAGRGGLLVLCRGVASAFAQGVPAACRAVLDSVRIGRAGGANAPPAPSDRRVVAHGNWSLTVPSDWVDAADHEAEVAALVRSPRGAEPSLAIFVAERAERGADAVADAFVHDGGNGLTVAARRAVGVGPRRVVELEYTERTDSPPFLARSVFLTHGQRLLVATCLSPAVEALTQRCDAMLQTARAR